MHLKGTIATTMEKSHFQVESYIIIWVCY